MPLSIGVVCWIQYSSGCGCSKLKRHVCELPWLSLVALGCPAVSIKKHLVVRCTVHLGGKALTKEDLDSYQSAIDLSPCFTGDDLN